METTKTNSEICPCTFSGWNMLHVCILLVGHEGLHRCECEKPLQWTRNGLLFNCDQDADD